MELSDKIKSLPNRPGIYQFKDEEGKVIYVGKAKKLRNRVKSYFNDATTHNGKTRVLVRKIKDLSYMEVESEQDALLLENNLIKEFKPRYNILLKDDKTFPWLCLKKEPFPRIFSTRTRVIDGSEYFGPYANVKLMKTLLSVATKLYPLRTCNFNLSPENIKAGKFKVCLEYHIGNCKGPCEGLQSAEDYNQGIKMIKDIIKGNTKEVLQVLERELSRVNQSGFARDNEELELGVRCIAAGIYDDQGKLLAGLSISAPADRLDESWLPKLQETAKAISQTLGHHQER